MNLALALLGTLASLLVVLAPITVLAAPLLALPVAACLRLAIVAIEDGVPRWRTAVEELGRGAGKKVLVAAVQLAVIVLAVLNVAVATSIGGVIGVASALVAVYGAVAVSLVALVLWPLLVDPRREMRLPDQVRLAIGLVLARPIQLTGLFALVVIGLLASVRFVAPAAVVPSFLLLTTAAFVVPSLDRLRPPDEN